MTVVASSSSSSAVVASSAAMSVNISIIGKPINVWNSVDTLNKCGIIDVPDIPARVYKDSSGHDGGKKYHMIEGSTHYHEMIGDTIFNFERNCDIAWDMTGDYNPGHYAGNEFLDSTWSFNNGTVITLIHTEYPGDNYNNCDLPPHASYPHCWTVSIGLGISYNYGSSWEHYKPPPHHLIATVPYKYNQTQLASGWGDPSNIILNPLDDKYYFAIWNRNQVGLQKPGICIVQNIYNNLLDPNSWRGWNGTNYSVRLDISPYNNNDSNDEDDDSTTTDDDSNKNYYYDPKDHICDVIPNIPTDCCSYGINYSTYLNKFIMTLGCPQSKKKHHKFYISFSSDLITWTDIQSFYDRNTDLPYDISQNVTSFSYPVLLDPSTSTSLVDDNNNNNNFDKIGRYPYLFWVSLGHSPYTDGRNLWATPMEFTIKTKTKLTNNDEDNDNDDDDDDLKKNLRGGNDDDDDKESFISATTATDTK